jgi:ATP-binding protein involved in chromosome partitioning
MSESTVQQRLIAALGRVRVEPTGPDVVTSGVVRSVKSEGGTVTIELAPRQDDPPALIETIRLVASGVVGVSEIRFALAEPGSRPPPDAKAGAAAGAPSAPQPRVRQGAGRALPVIEPVPREAAPPPAPSAGQVSREEASRHPRDAEPLAGVGHVIAVSSGKGGVGKSTISTNLAAAWAAQGHRVGLLDADIYGPDIPTMFGAFGKPRMRDEKVIPVEAHGVKLMSLGFLVGEDTPAVWRGPIVMGIVRQFIHQVDWGELDYLIVPGHSEPTPSDAISRRPSAQSQGYRCAFCGLPALGTA